MILHYDLTTSSAKTTHDAGLLGMTVVTRDKNVVTIWHFLSSSNEIYV